MTARKLIAPQPSASDEERARVIAEKRYRDDETIGWLTNAIVRFAAAVRAEATLAENERCVKVLENPTVSSFTSEAGRKAFIAAIRDRK
jgi:predicted type IV restriction endonuclease